MKRRFGFVTGLAILAVIGVLGYTGGCASSSLPPALTPSQKALIRDTRFAASLGIERYSLPAYSDGLTKALQATGLFERVSESTGLKSPPDLLARIERPIYGKATVPCLTGISLGLIPTTVREEHGYSFSLVGGSVPAGERVPVEFSYSGPTTLGWYSLVLNLSPDRTKDDVYDHHRFRDGLAWAVIEKRDQVLKLLKKGGA
jgi:hypothetical protein